MLILLQIEHILIGWKWKSRASQFVLRIWMPHLHVRQNLMDEFIILNELILKFGSLIIDAIESIGVYKSDIVQGFLHGDCRYICTHTHINTLQNTNGTISYFMDNQAGILLKLDEQSFQVAWHATDRDMFSDDPYQCLKDHYGTCWLFDQFTCPGHLKILFDLKNLSLENLNLTALAIFLILLMLI